MTNQNTKLKGNYLIISKLQVKIKLDPKIKKIQRVSFKPTYGGYRLIVQYKTNKEISYLPDNGKYIGIDPGVDNAFACAGNTGACPLLINGRSLKSVNQYYNKERSRLKSLQTKYRIKKREELTKSQEETTNGI
ncbi:hypothetical protein BDKNPLJD_01985 [Lactobacillus helveticus]|uniref:Probable transposase IS891/IS1136/IS1341 domain-containing protein n=1 Tax=Lactobacillus helveticus TaxID=1587 RepID=A0A2X0R8G6_LACHE|nr:hypothetical protein LHEJCM1007_12280 [Lactobacillus helveticus]GFP13284.1 hypothetical protein LHEJCM1062_11560 [Lactobacillus helveticus]SPS15137.1 hypothetical protein BDKNPLJD_01985 [Lactobacillus helveticus]